MAVWAEVTGGGGGGSIQVLGACAADPKVASILPSNQNLYAVYKQDSVHQLFKPLILEYDL